MDYHLERRLRLHTEPEYKNLYRWAINETDAQDRPVGGDQIPWPWTLYFTATSCVLSDGIDVKAKGWRTDGTPLATREIDQHQVIFVELRPGSPRDDARRRRTTFSMFGTDRTIKSFQLQIRQLADPAEQERCEAWGTVSYTTELDFRSDTTEDCIIFSLFVKPETFARYAAKVSDASVDEISFSARSVDGFYSDWSPSISTDSVKVLTTGEEHEVHLPPKLEFAPPRLGFVGEAQISINRRREFAKGGSDLQPIEEAEPVEPGTVLAEPRASVAAEPQTLEMLRSLKRAAWFVVVLLTLILLGEFVRG